MLKRLSLFILAATLFAALFVSRPVHADTLSTSINIGWDETNCWAVVNGVGGDSVQYGVDSGDNLTVTVHNVSSVTLGINIGNNTEASVDTSNPPTTTIAAGGSFTTTLSNITNIDDGSDIIGYSMTTSCSGVELAGISALPATGSMSCSLSSDKSTWDITGTYASFLNGTVFNGSNANVSTVDSAIFGNATSFSLKSSPQSVAQTYYLRVASTPSSRLVAQATCPAYTPPSTGSGSSTGSSSSGNPSGSKSSASTTATTNSGAPVATTTTATATPTKTASATDVTAKTGAAQTPSKTKHAIWQNAAVVIPASLVLIGGLGFVVLKLGWASFLMKYLPKKP